MARNLTLTYWNHGGLAGDTYNACVWMRFKLNVVYRYYLIERLSAGCRVGVQIWGSDVVREEQYLLYSVAERVSG